MASTFRPSYKGIGEMLNAEFMRQAMLNRAEKIATLAGATAPVYEGTDTEHEPGRYKRSFKASAGTHGGVHHDRAYGRVENDAPEAAIVEFGNSKTPRYATLRNAAAAGGD